ncbi:MAG: WbqC family protein [Flavobacteriales bacterium]|nr:WbqC family protein [Flavobacteriales bacterium]
MTLAVMQPYLFPYLGYFQLIHAVDRFVVYDDVNYMKQGWVNRNRVLVNGEPHMFTLPLRGASSFAMIHELEIDPRQFGPWRDKFLRTLGQAYAKAPHVQRVQELVRSLFEGSHYRLEDALLASLRGVMHHLHIHTEVVPSSRKYGNAHLRGQDRVLDICKQEGAKRYVNAIGGKDLYEKAVFGGAGIELRFLRSALPPYPQFAGPFVPGLSIIDVLMFNGPEEVRGMLDQYTFE